MSNTCQKLWQLLVENTRQINTKISEFIILHFAFERMRPIKHLLINIIVNGAVLYVIANYIPELGFQIQSIYKDTYIIFGILGLLFWLINSVLKNILKVLTLPIKMLTLGIFSLILNIVVLYIFEQTVNYLDIGIIVQLGSILQVLILSVILSLIYVVIKKII